MRIVSIACDHVMTEPTYLFSGAPQAEISSHFAEKFPGALAC